MLHAYDMHHIKEIVQTYSEYCQADGRGHYFSLINTWI